MKNRSSHLKIVAGTLALGLLIFGCGKKEGSPASTPSSSGESPSRQSAPTSSMKLPEFHGLYALDGDRLVELGKNAKFEDCKLGPGANFLFFDKAVSTGLSSLAESPHLQRYGFVRYQVSGVSGNTDLAGFQAATVTTVNDWRKQGKPVECRTKPVEKQAEMIQIVPPEPLQPGAYAMEGSKAVFVVSLEKSLPFDEFPESYRPASELDAVVADGKLLASRSLESKDWKRALELIQGGLKISPASPDFLELQKTAYYGSAMQEATRLEEAQEFGAAFKAYGLARVWRSSDEAANAGIARVKEQATRDPAAFVEIGKSVVGKSECIQDLAFNSDGTSVTVVSGCPTRNEPLTVLTFDGNLGSVIAKFEKENSYAIMTSFALSPDASVLAIGSPDSPYSGDDRRISLWDVASNKTLKSFENLDGKFHFLDFDASKTLILARDWNECIQLWNVAAAGRPITPKRVPWEGYFISTGTFSRDGKLFAAAAGDRDYGRGGIIVKVWDSASLKEVQSYVGHEGIVNSIAFSPDATLLATASADKQVILWDVSNGKKVRTLLGHQAEVSCVLFTLDGRKILTAGNDARIYVWKTSTGELLGGLPGHTAAVDHLALNPAGTRLASASKDMTIRVWGVK